MIDLARAVLLGSGLAVDSCVVALAQGIASAEHRARRALVVGAVFGAFQGAMPVLGWFVGAPVARLFASFAPWVAFAVLGVLGAKSIRDALRCDDANDGVSSYGARWLIAAAVATSIDALAAGFGLSLAGQPIAPTAIAAGLITALGSTASYLAGRGLGLRHRRVAQFVAGIVLIGIGAQILYAHWRGS